MQAITDGLRYCPPMSHDSPVACHRWLFNAGRAKHIKNDCSKLQPFLLSDIASARWPSVVVVGLPLGWLLYIHGVEQATRGIEDAIIRQQGSHTRP